MQAKSGSAPVAALPGLLLHDSVRSVLSLRKKKKKNGRGFVGSIQGLQNMGAFTRGCFGTSAVGTFVLHVLTRTSWLAVYARKLWLEP